MFVVASMTTWSTIVCGNLDGLEAVLCDLLIIGTFCTRCPLLPAPTTMRMDGSLSEKRDKKCGESMATTAATTTSMAPPTTTATASENNEKNEKNWTNRRRLDDSTTTQSDEYDYLSDVYSHQPTPTCCKLEATIKRKRLKTSKNNNNSSLKIT